MPNRDVHVRVGAAAGGGYALYMSTTPMMAPEIRKVQKEKVVHAASQIQINNPRSRLS